MLTHRFLGDVVTSYVTLMVYVEPDRTPEQQARVTAHPANERTNLVGCGGISVWV